SVVRASRRTRLLAPLLPVCSVLHARTGCNPCALEAGRLRTDQDRSAVPTRLVAAASIRAITSPTSGSAAMHFVSRPLSAHHMDAMTRRAAAPPRARPCSIVVVAVVVMDRGHVGSAALHAH